MLRTISKDVEFPMSEDDIFLINSMIQYLRLSQDEEYALKYNIRAGMGLSAVQLGVLKGSLLFLIKMMMALLKNIK